MINLQQLEMKNFMPFKGDNYLSFPDSSSNRNVLLVFGDNMRGKTSILNAIRWCFYGKALNRNMRPYPILSIINKVSAAEKDWTCDVKIRYETESAQYELIRRVKKKDTTINPKRDSDFIMELYMKENGRPVPGSNIESIINRLIPEETSRFFLFDGELLQEYENLLIEGDETGESIKEAIERVLGVPAITNGRNELGAIRTAANKQLLKENAQDVRLKKQEKRMGELELKILEEEEDISNFVSGLERCKKDISEIATELDEIERLHAKKAQLDSARKHLSDLEEGVEGLKQQRLIARSDVWKELIQPRISEKLKSLREELSDYGGISEKLYQHKVMTKQYEHINSKKTCPTCNQKMDAEGTNLIKNNLERLTKEASLYNETEILSRKNDVSEKIKILEEIRPSGVKATLEWIDKEISQNEIKRTAEENKIAILENDLHGTDIAEVTKKRNRYNSLLIQKGKIQQEKSERHKELDKDREEYSDLSNMLINMTSGVSTELTRKVSLCNELYSSFDESIGILRDSLKDIVEKYATEAFKLMSTQPLYKGLSINSNYGLNIINHDGNILEIRSAGAEQVVALSLIVGLGRISLADGPIIMDTPFGRLDKKHRSSVLKYFPQVANQLILLVHDGEVDRERDLDSIKDRIGNAVEIIESGPDQSALVKVIL